MKRRIFLGASVAALATACRAAPTAQTWLPTPTPLPLRPSTTAAPARSARDVLYIRDDYGVRGPGQIAIVDAATGRRLGSLPIGLWSRDWSALYTATWEDGKTTLQAVDPATGAVVHRTTLNDIYDLAGLSPNDHWLVVRWEPSREEAKTFEKDGKWKSRYLVLDQSLAPTPGMTGAPIALDGEFWFDALADDGSALFLIENLNPPYSDQYQVRLFDLTLGSLQPGVIADKTGSEVMSGSRQSSIFSPDRAWLYSLYLNQTKGPFIHALNLAQRFAVCIDLPATGKDDGEKLLLWTMAMTPDGKTLYAANGALGLAASIDLAKLQVARTANFPVASAAAPSPFARLAEWLAPVAEAKRILMGGSALPPDGRTLFAVGEKGLLALDTSDLTVDGHYLPDRPLDSVALNPEGSSLYVVDAASAAVLALDPVTGQTRATIHGADHPWGVLRVVQASED